MIEVRVEPDRISVTGHANYAPRGYDIVCEDVSVLVQTLSMSISHLTDDMLEDAEVPGKSILITKHLSDEKSKLLIDAFLIGIEAVANMYPEHVKLVQA